MAPYFLSKLTKRSKDKAVKQKNEASRLNTSASAEERASTSQLPAPLLSLDLPSSSLITPAAGHVLSPGALGSDSVASLGRDVDLGVGEGGENSPWVDLGRHTGGIDPSSGYPVGADVGRCQRAKLPPSQAEEIARLCGNVIKERGLETLGLLRPWRFQESQGQIVKLRLLFLDYLQPSPPAAQDVNRTAVGGTAQGLGDMFSMRRVTLDDVKDELMFASLSDVASVFKWAIRHITYSSSSATGFANSPTWYSDFAKAEADRSWPKDAYGTILQPLLPHASRKLLDSVLDLISAVAAHADSNAMPGAKLCKALGFWIFGKGEEVYKTYDSLYFEWDRAGRAMEHVFAAYLRNQSKLPRRLRELVGQYPGGSGGQGHKVFKAQITTAEVKVVRVQVATEGAWLTEEMVSTQPGNGEVRRKGSLGKKRRSASMNTVSSMYGAADKAKIDRTPVQVVLAALEADEPPSDSADEATKLWKSLVSRARAENAGGRPELLALLSDETGRVLEITYPAVAQSEHPISPTLTRTVSVKSHGSSRSRRRSFSVDSPSPTKSRALSTLYEDQLPRRPSVASGGAENHVGPTKRVSISGANGKPGPLSSWSDFVSSGFGSSGNDLLVKFNEEANVADQGESRRSEDGSVMRRSSSKRRRTLPGDRRASLDRFSRGATSQESLVETPTEPEPLSTPDPPKMVTVVLSVSAILVDETFPDFWLDTLGEKSILIRWPLFVIAALQSKAVAGGARDIKHVLIEETLKDTKKQEPEAPAEPVPPAPQPQSAPNPQLSSSKSVRSNLFSGFTRKANRRSGLFRISSKLSTAASASPKSTEPSRSPPPAKQAIAEPSAVSKGATAESAVANTAKAVTAATHSTPSAAATLPAATSDTKEAAGPASIADSGDAKPVVDPAPEKDEVSQPPANADGPVAAESTPDEGVVTTEPEPEKRDVAEEEPAMEKAPESRAAGEDLAPDDAPIQAAAAEENAKAEAVAVAVEEKTRLEAEKAQAAAEEADRAAIAAVAAAAAAAAEAAEQEKTRQEALAREAAEEQHRLEEAERQKEAEAAAAREQAEREAAEAEAARLRDEEEKRAEAEAAAEKARLEAEEAERLRREKEAEEVERRVQEERRLAEEAERKAQAAAAAAAAAEEEACILLEEKEREAAENAKLQQEKAIAEAEEAERLKAEETERLEREKIAAEAEAARKAEQEREDEQKLLAAEARCDQSEQQVEAEPEAQQNEHHILPEEEAETSRETEARKLGTTSAAEGEQPGVEAASTAEASHESEEAETMVSEGEQQQITEAEATRAQHEKEAVEAAEAAAEERRAADEIAESEGKAAAAVEQTCEEAELARKEDIHQLHPHQAEEVIMQEGETAKAETGSEVDPQTAKTRQLESEQESTRLGQETEAKRIQLEQQQEAEQTRLRLEHEAELTQLRLEQEAEQTRRMQEQAAQCGMQLTDVSAITGNNAKHPEVDIPAAAEPTENGVLVVLQPETTEANATDDDGRRSSVNFPRDGPEDGETTRPQSDHSTSASSQGGQPSPTSSPRKSLLSRAGSKLRTSFSRSRKGSAGSKLSSKSTENLAEKLEDVGTPLATTQELPEEEARSNPPSAHSHDGDGDGDIQDILAKARASRASNPSKESSSRISSDLVADEPSSDRLSPSVGSYKNEGTVEQSIDERTPRHSMSEPAVVHSDPLVQALNLSRGGALTEAEIEEAIPSPADSSEERIFQARLESPVPSFITTDTTRESFESARTS